MEQKIEQKVEVRLFAFLRENRGKRVYVNPDTTNNILNELKISQEDAYICLLNGKDITDRDLKLSQGDVLSIFPQVGGG